MEGGDRTNLSAAKESALSAAKEPALGGAKGHNRHVVSGGSVKREERAGEQKPDPRRSLPGRAGH